jgi:superfamily II DNA or RNA helicase
MQVMADLQKASQPLLIAGYSALDHLIDLMSELEQVSQLRILFGSEPFPAKRGQFEMSGAEFPREVEAYWLSRGISLRLSGKLIRARDLLREGRVRARYLGTSRSRLHAKMYCGDDAITVGSSNFTDPGLRHQIEANVRFTNRDGNRFSEARQIAENFWTSGQDYSAELLALLEQLLKVVTWEEALARASAELLDGDWARAYLQHQLLPGDQPLWPSQVQGIAQALWLMETVGSVLVADATGSGKTRMGAHLMRAVVDRIWGSGRIRKGSPVLICPPSVGENWQREARLCGVGLDIQSHGSLSQAGGDVREGAREAIRRAQILAVDEAHNFLNPRSARTQMLFGNMSDHTILFTATPINRSVVDLLRLADMLGADNFDDQTLDVFKTLLKRRSKFSNLAQSEQRQLRSAIQRFTVRRTKKHLNELVDEDPDNFKDATGRNCRFPHHSTNVYSLQESGPDRQIAARIREVAGNLTGVALIKRPIEMPAALLADGWDEGKYLESRLLAVRKLAEYLIMSALRSSKAALLEHLTGTEKALSAVELDPGSKRQSTGDVIGGLRRAAGHPPGSKLKTAEVPAWLTDPKEHEAKAQGELAVYGQILALANELSLEREAIKGQQLLTLLDEHEQIVAFDSKPITLAYMAKLLRGKLPEGNVIVATGESASGKKQVRSMLAPGSTARRTIALCSDAMSEGINLQQASAVLHLDMPSVVRIAEQRVGRVDRMDSPHAKIEVWWPEDSPEFALRRDERFIERYETVESLIGANMPLPPELVGLSPGEPVRALELATEYENQAAESDWDGVQDAFAPVRELVSGESALVGADTYRHYRHVTARVVSRVSLVSSESPWAFFCVGGTRTGAPHWVFIESGQPSLVTQIKEIADELRKRLTPGTKNLKFDDRAARVLDGMLERLVLGERGLLPRRKQRALEEMEIILNRYAKQSSGKDALRLSHLISVFGQDHRTSSIDWDDLAERWLDLVRPVWYARLLTPKRRRPLTLREIRKDLMGEKKIPLGTLLASFEGVHVLPPIEERVVSCIIGISQEKPNVDLRRHSGVRRWLT